MPLHLCSNRSNGLISNCVQSVKNKKELCFGMEERYCIRTLSQFHFSTNGVIYQGDIFLQQISSESGQRSAKCMSSGKNERKRGRMKI